MDWKKVTAELAQSAAAYDEKPGWPYEALAVLTDAGAWRWSVPEAYGGDPLSGVDKLRAYEAIARGSVTVALILTQRDGACEIIAHSDNTALKDCLLPAYAAGERFTSVGISQLTTSEGAGGKPHMVAEPTEQGFTLRGAMPWVTGALQCDEFVCGAVLPDGLQLLCIVPRETPRVQVCDPFRLTALEASQTCRVTCDNVHVLRADVIKGPTEVALSMRGPVKPLVVSSVGLGLAGALLDLVDEHAESAADDMQAPLQALRAAYHELRDRLYTEGEHAVNDPDHSVPKVAIRVEVNVLLERLASAALLVSKGRGYVPPHPAQRLVREALFFHVWSAPTEVRARTLRRIVGGGD
jgi:alkylation response protein AidB-like acyl-CoA dehydrogenase